MREGYEDLTVYGVVDIHVARATEQGSPLTIKDHLFLDDCNDLPLRESFYRKIFQGLKIGGDFHQHLGGVYVLTERRGGRQPEGFGDDPPKGHDKHKFVPSKSLVAAVMQGVASANYRFNSTVPAINRTTQAAATIKSKRVQEAIVAAPLAMEQELAFTQQQLEYAERENEMLRSGRIVAGALEAPRRGRTPLNQNQPGNGNGSH